ncbi:MAG: redoxin domain-containing protein [Streptosporangiales bacterium]|nr:redoxin domain-containing protein [Streptosporangiales bacterium]
MTVSRPSFRPVLVRLAAAVMATAFAAAACGTQPAGPPEAGDAAGGPAAQRAPLDFQAKTVDGGEFSGSELDGKPAVLWFWAPWCTICRSEGPAMARVARKHAEAVTFVGVAGRGEVPDMRRFVDDTGTGSFTHAVDEDGSLWSSFGVTSQPAYAFVRPDGGMEVIVGSLPEGDLAERVAALAGRGGRPEPR